MKTQMQSLLLVLACASLPVMTAAAQTFTTLHSFNSTNDGAYAAAGLIISGNTLYGTTYQGDTNGTVFAVNADGTGFTTLHNFSATVYDGSANTNSDGADPKGGLILSGSTLYGTANGGGTTGNGTVFAVNTDGTGFTTVHNFTGVSGGNSPFAGLILSGSTLYGTVYGGGTYGFGAVFAVNTDGSDFTILHSFNSTNDGAYPVAGLVLSGNTLYGTVDQYGPNDGGTVFAVNTNGSDFTVLCSLYYNGVNGANPVSGLIISSNILYGTLSAGGTSGNGTVFAVSTNGTDFTTLHNFSADSYNGSTFTNNDGANPKAGLILSGNTLYGTATYGGPNGNGTVFVINTNGTGFTNLYSFVALPSGESGPGSPPPPPQTNSSGAYPYAGLILSGSTLYGTAYGGGNSADGTVFSFALLPPPPPSLNIVPVTGNNQSVIYWPGSGNYVLQSTTNLVSPNWVTATDAVPVNAFTVSNTLPARYFRLQSP